MRHELKRRLMYAIERYYINKSIRNEVKKYQDPLRRELTARFSLSEEQKGQVDAFFLKHYGEKIPYTWHQHFSSYTGRFDVAYFPEQLYIPKFERYMNTPGYDTVLSDKCVLPILAGGLGIRIPETVFALSRGVFRDGAYHIVSREDAVEELQNAGEVYLKISVDSGGGEGCYRADFRNGTDRRTGKTVEAFFQELGGEIIIQKAIETHPKLSAFDRGSAATFRVITYFWRGEVHACPLTLRIGIHNSPVANAAIIIAIDDDGTLHPEGYSKFGDRFTEHPDSHIRFGNYRVEDTPAVIAAAKRMHEAFPQVGIINWDFTIDKDGQPVLIEANTKNGSIWLPEFVHGKSAFGERTGEILEWIRFMDKVNPEDRHFYHHGWVKR